MNTKTSVLIVFAIMVATIPRANAYLDPGTGSYLIQIIIGGLLAGGASIGMFWRRIKVKRDIFKKEKNKNESDETR